MTAPKFVVHPALLNAVMPVFLRRGFRFAIGGLVTYGLFTALGSQGLITYSEERLLLWLGIVVFGVSFVSIKHRLIRLHNTRYLFYDTHVVKETRFFNVRRHSVPYKQIARVTNDSSLWDRLTGASDLILHTSRHQEAKDLVLESVPDGEDIEHRIYEMLKRDRKEEGTGEGKEKEGKGEAAISETPERTHGAAE